MPPEKINGMLRSVRRTTAEGLEPDVLLLRQYRPLYLIQRRDGVIAPESSGGVVSPQYLGCMGGLFRT